MSGAGSLGSPDRSTGSQWLRDCSFDAARESLQLVLAAVVLILVLGSALLYRNFGELAGAGEQINLAGRQRMLVEQVALLSLQLSDADASVDRSRIAGRLSAALHQLEHSREQLQSERGKLPAQLRNLYFRPPNAADRWLGRFLESGTRLVGSGAAAQLRSSPDLRFIHDTLPSLVERLDRVVMAYQLRYEQRLQQGLIADGVLRAALVLLLVVSAGLLLRDRDARRSATIRTTPQAGEPQPVADILLLPAENAAILLPSAGGGNGRVATLPLLRAPGTAPAPHTATGEEADPVARPARVAAAGIPCGRDLWGANAVDTGAEDELRRRKEQLATFQILADEAQRGVDMHFMMQSAAFGIYHTLHAKPVLICELIRGNRKFVVPAGVGVPKSLIQGEACEISRHSLLGTALRSRRPVHQSSEAHALWLHDLPGLDRQTIASGVAAVIRDAQGPVGLVAAFSDRAGHFCQEDIDYLESIANVLGLDTDRVQRRSGCDILVTAGWH